MISTFPTALWSVLRAWSWSLLLLVTALPLVAAQPRANDGTLTVRDGATSVGYLRATGDRGTVLVYEIVAQGSKGTASLTVGNRLGLFSFAVKSGVNPVGTDQFTFRVTDSRSRVSNTATVQVTFNNRTVITWNQPTPITYGNPISTPAIATAGGLPVAGTFVYTPSLGTMLNAGTRRIAAEFTPAAGGAKVTSAKNVRVNTAQLRVTSNAIKVYGAVLPTLLPTYVGFVNGDTIATVLSGAPTLSTTATVSSPVASYPITISRGSLRASSNYSLLYVNGILSVTPAAASITLASLNHTYDGNGHGASVTTTPSGLATSVTYDGSTLLPVDAGSYAVSATVTNPNYVGSAMGTVVIARAAATVTLSNLAQTYDGLSHGVTVATNPANLTTNVAFAGGITPINAGSYPVNVTVSDPNYSGASSDTLVIAKATAAVTLTDLTYTYDGNAHAATVTTVPAGVGMVVSYNASDVLPINAGSYAVVASVFDPNYSGSGSDALSIAQAHQTISFAPLHDVTVGDVAQVLTATSPAGLPITFSVSGPAVITTGLLQVNGSGTITVTATQAGDLNHFAATPVVQSITASETGAGLLASYFSNETLSGVPVLIRTDSQIDFDWAGGSPASSVPADSFSVRWDGEIKPRFNEAYTLTFRTDDGVRVWLDGQMVVNNWNLRSATDSTYTFNAEAGRRYLVRVEYYEHTGLAVAKLWWRSASETSGPIPVSQLFPTPPDTSAPIGSGVGLTASYFANEILAGVPVFTRLDTMNFDWAGGSPAPSVTADSFSARWSGSLQPRYSEPYTLTLRTDDGVRMWLDGQLVINDWFLRGAADSTYTFNAEAGRHYAIRVEYYERFGSAVAQLNWYSAHEYSGPVPATQLYPLPTPVVSVADVSYPLAEGESISLAGTVTNVGSATMTYAWTQVSGPGMVTFQTSNQTNTIARFPVTGSYEMKLWAFNGHVTVSDSTTITVVASDVSNDLVAHYTFDETTGSVASDTSGKQHTGTIVGASHTDGKSKGALHFTGGSYVYAMNNEDLDVPIQALTLAVWLKPDTTLAQMAHPWPMPIYRAQYEDSSGYALMATSNDGDQFGLRLHHQSGFGQMIEANTTAPLTSGAWIHTAGVYDGATAKLYLDGILVQSVVTGPITLRNAPNSPLFLGYGFEGLMDEVRIYHRALSRTDLYGLAQDGSDRRTPGADAGADQIVTLLTPTTVFAGSASDDAASGATLVPTWKQVAGPAQASLSNQHSFAPQVTFSATGSYRFQLEVTDGVLTGRDEMRVIVTDGAVDVVSGLILHYRADEGTGALVADSSGKNHDGTFLGNPQWSDAGEILGAMKLDGSSIVSTPSAADLNGLTQMTLSLWMRADRALVNMAHPWPFALNHADYASNRGFALMTTLADTNTFGFRLHTGTGRREVTMDGVTVGGWMHVVATFDGQTMRLFRDGVLVDINVTGPIPLPSLDAPLQIGEGFEGLFDDVRIYDRALSPTEVQSLHALPPLAASG